MKRNIWQYLAGVVVLMVVGLVCVVIYGLASGVIWVSNLIDLKVIFQSPRGIVLGIFIGLFIDNLGTLAISIFNKITKGAVEQWFMRTKANGEEKKKRRKANRQKRKERKAAKRRRSKEMYRNADQYDHDDATDAET